ncbi:hypothetical protein J4210_03705 [Candidatus Woesearchaeota archaeon]|nr:hypothetical protein [Candidatus Woesearchaeota archaeon]
MPTIMPEEEARMEAVLPILVTDVMQALEDRGKHPEEDFTERLRVALRLVVPRYPEIEDAVWDPEKKKLIVEETCKVIQL